VLEYSEFRHFLPVIEKAREACLNSAHHVEEHFEQILEMVSIGSGAQRPIGDRKRSRYACYFVIQNADPKNRS
jgi:DNA-damage-inducible protein D